MGLRVKDYSHITNEDFDEMLERVIEENVHEILSIPGAYEIFAEHYNNTVLDRLLPQEDETC